MPLNKLKIHLVQFPARYPEPLKTLKDLEKLLSGLAVSPGDWLVFPEMWPGSFNPKDAFRQKLEQAFCFYWLKAYARKNRVYLSGSMLEMPREKAYNSAYVIGPKGDLLTRYRKMHLISYMGEDRQYHPGREISVTPFKGSSLGLAICFDLRFPEQFRAMVKRGAQWIIVPSAWPKERLEHYQALLKARAIENQCFIISTNKCGPEKDAVVFAGHSMVLNPWGESLGELGARKSILSVTLDLTQVNKIRKKYRFLPF